MVKERVKLQSRQKIPVSPEIVRTLDGNVAAAFFYAQIQFYARTDPGPDWIFKDSTEIEHDTGLNRDKQRYIRRALVDKGLIEIVAQRGGRKPRIGFRVIVDFQ